MSDHYTTGEARSRFSDVINKAAYREERVVLTRHGKHIAAVVPISDLELLHEIERVLDVNDGVEALRELRSGKSTTLDEFKHELGLKGGPNIARTVLDSARGSGKTRNKKAVSRAAKKSR